MPYVNIKESTIVNGVAKQIGAVQDIATAKVYDLVNDSIQKVRRSSCPPLEETQRLQQRINSVTSSISNISIRINKFKKIAKTILTLVRVFNIIRRLVLKLPIPQSVPPGFGLPVGFSMVQTDLLHKFKEKIKQGTDDSKGIIEVLKSPADNIGMYTKILGRINIVSNGCRLEGVLKREVAKGRITNERLQALGIIKDGRYIFSEIGPNLFDDLDFTRDGDLYENNSANGTKNKQEIADNAENDLLGALQKLDKEGIDIGDIFNAFKGETEDQRLSNPDNFYTAANGEVYELKIRLDKDSPSIAPRRFAVAIDKFGVEILKGPKSFSSDTKVLIDELKFRLDNQLP
tara:strand:- start:201 stop:1238 length:1038 start_codon:yes stop_codon:yes gene_type:complete